MDLDKLDETEYQLIASKIKTGRLVPFLGAGVNLCARPLEPGKWSEKSGFLPSGAELSEYLANTYRYPADVSNPAEKKDLLRVSQYIYTARGKSNEIYEKLHSLLDYDFPITPLHRFLAAIPKTVRDSGPKSYFPLIVTTNYDDVLERAFQEAGESYDLVCYEAKTEDVNKGRFWHLYETEANGGQVLQRALIDDPTKYVNLPMIGNTHNLHRTLILKMHGEINRKEGDHFSDSYVITEDDYIDFSARSTADFIPAQIEGKLQRSQFLFMGYSLRDWNLRIILNNIWKNQKISADHWAIQYKPNEIDVMFWQKRGVKIYDILLEEFVVELAKQLDGGGGKA